MSTAEKRSAREGAPRPHRTTEAERAEIVRLHRAGLSPWEIAGQLDRSPPTIYRVLDHAGDPRRRKPQRLSAHEGAFIERCAREGWSAPAIAEALGRTEGAIHNYLQRNEIAYVRAHGARAVRAPRMTDGIGEIRIPTEVRARVPSVARRVGTLSGTARELGLHDETVEKILRVDAPLVLARVRQGAISTGHGISRNAGDLTKIIGAWREDGLQTTGDFDDLIVDYGADTVRGWIERFEADRTAARKLIGDLRRALVRAGEGQP